jgi:hypothetical protein
LAVARRELVLSSAPVPPVKELDPSVKAYRMHSQQIALGSVYETEPSPNPVRVVVFDDQVVMYDTWWPHKGACAMAKLLGAFTYY